MSRFLIPLPAALGPAFSTAEARSAGVSPQRLRGADLAVPHRGVRIRPDALSPHSLRSADEHAPISAAEKARATELRRIEALATRRIPGQFFSHRSAALLWGAPLPHLADAPLHLSVHGPHRAPRVDGVTGHSLSPRRYDVTSRGGIPCTSAASTWASLGELSLADLVAAGDHLVRVHRPGYGRPLPQRAPYTSRAQLRKTLELGRWRGGSRLAEALSLIREDSWSPAESHTRVIIVRGGLPEPELNVDLTGPDGQFLACVDLAYLDVKIAIEYQSVLHARQYAQDVERIERLRAHGWWVIQVTSALLRDPERLVARVGEALVERGWRGEQSWAGQ